MGKLLETCQELGPLRQRVIVLGELEQARECRVAVDVARDVRIGIVGEQQFDRAQLQRLRRHVQWAFAEWVTGRVAPAPVQQREALGILRAAA